MSGFAGVISSDGAAADTNLLQQMVKRLEFRGPHGSRVWTQSEAGFCFTLLQTGPAPQCKTQPCTIDGQVWLLGDVRLDGRSDLKRVLEGSGESFSSEVSDEELVLLAWRRWGKESLEQLLGDFSFALWDQTAHKLICVRDLFGIRPFFYAHLGRRLYFSNTLDVLRLAPEFTSTLDGHFVGDYLLRGWSGDPERTVYREIHRLPAAHLLEYSNGQVQTRRFAALPIEEPSWLKRPEEYVEQFQGLLREAVADRLPADRAGIFFSGGLDSTSVAATAVSRVDYELFAHTADCRPLFDDPEARFAAMAAAHLSIPIDILAYGSSEPFQSWKHQEYVPPEPSNDPFRSVHLRLYQRVATHARVVLSGEGGDSIMMGQAWPHLRYLLRRSKIATVAKPFGAYILSHARFPTLRAGVRTRIRGWLSPGDSMSQYPSWLEPGFEREFRLRERWHELEQPIVNVHPMHPDAYGVLSGNYWASVFEDEDSGYTGVPVEARAPFLDQRLVRFLLRVPAVPWCMEKEILRCAMREMLPDEVRLRPKTPLVQDPFFKFVENGWRPSPVPGMHPALHPFVNWTALTEALKRPLAPNFLTSLGVMSFHYWLKHIEIR